MPGTQFDLSAWLAAHGARRAGRGEWVIVCPTCGKRKLTVDVERGIWHCWVCQRYAPDEKGKRRAVAGAGDLVALLCAVDGLPMARAIALAESVRDPRLTRVPVREVLLDTANAGDARSREISPPPGWRPIEHAQDWPYLRKRGLTDVHVRWLQLVVCTEGEYAGRLVFPVLDRRGRLIYWQARAMWEVEEHDPAAGPYRKVLNPPREEGAVAGAADVLLNLEVARTYPRIAIVEGPIDVAHAGRSAVGTFGKRLSYTQLLLLRDAGVRAVDLMWDGPTEREPQGAWPEMRATAPLLSSVIPDVRLVKLPFADPGTYSESECDAFRGRALPAGEYGRLALLG